MAQGQTQVVVYDHGWEHARSGADFAMVIGRADRVMEGLATYPRAMVLTITEANVFAGGESVDAVAMLWTRTVDTVMTGIRQIDDLTEASEIFKHRLANTGQTGEGREVLVFGPRAKELAEELGGVAIGCEHVGIDGAAYDAVVLALPKGSVTTAAGGLGGVAEGLMAVGRESMLVFGDAESQAATVSGLGHGGSITVGVGECVWPRQWSPLVALAVIESCGFEPSDNVSEMAGLIDGYLKRATVKNEVVDVDARLHEDVQGRKMEAVGQLAAGVAHEINTPVQYIGDSVGFLSESWTAISTMLALGGEIAQGKVAGSQWDVRRSELDLDFFLEEAPSALARARDGVDRVASIVRAMKAFAHPDAEEMRAANINEGIANTLIVARNEIKYVARLDTEYGDLPMVVCWQGHINQVVLNLVVNAAHAIKDAVQGTGKMGVVTVKTQIVDGAVRVSVSDTGTGIKPAHREKIWDMFFTTKPVGLGTGHGLAIARKIIERHNGRIWFETQEGVGTTFYFDIPITKTVVEGEAEA